MRLAVQRCVATACVWPVGTGWGCIESGETSKSDLVAGLVRADPLIVFSGVVTLLLSGRICNKLCEGDLWLGAVRGCVDPTSGSTWGEWEDVACTVTAGEELVGASRGAVGGLEAVVWGVEEEEDGEEGLAVVVGASRAGRVEAAVARDEEEIAGEGIAENETAGDVPLSSSASSTV